MRARVIMIVSLLTLAGAGVVEATTPPGDDEPTLEDLSRAETSFTGAAEGEEYDGLEDVACTIDEKQAICYAAMGDNVVSGSSQWSDRSRPTWTFAEFVDPATIVPTTTTTTTTVPAGTGTRESPIPIGVAAPVGGGWTMTVNAVNLNATDVVMGANQFNSPPIPGSQYVIVNITATYNGVEPSDTAGVNLKALGPSNVTLESGGSSYPVPPTPYEGFVEVFQGGSTSGDVVFEVPSTDVENIVVIAQAFMSFDNAERAFFATK